MNIWHPVFRLDNVVAPKEYHITKTFTVNWLQIVFRRSTYHSLADALE